MTNNLKEFLRITTEGKSREDSEKINKLLGIILSENAVETSFSITKNIQKVVDGGHDLQRALNIMQILFKEGSKQKDISGDFKKEVEWLTNILLTENTKNTYMLTKTFFTPEGNMFEPQMLTPYPNEQDPKCYYIDKYNYVEIDFDIEKEELYRREKGYVSFNKEFVATNKDFFRKI